MSSFNELMIMADKINRSSIVPSSLRAPHELLTAMLFIQELGLPLISGLQNIAVINGKPTLNSHLLWALVMKQKDLKKVSVSSDNLKATVKIERSLGDFESSFTIEDATKAGLLGKSGGGWNTYPRQMLEARAKSLCARLAYPEALFGIYSSEEMRDGSLDKEENSNPIVVESSVNNDFEVLERKKKAFLDKLVSLKEQGEIDEDQYFYFGKRFNTCENEDCLTSEGLELKKVLEENRAMNEKIKEQALKAQNQEVFEVSEEEFENILKDPKEGLQEFVDRKKEEKQDKEKGE